MKGDAHAMRDLTTINPSARAKVETWLAALPESARSRFPDPESVVALFFSQAITGHDSVRVISEDTSDLEHATLKIAFENTPDGILLPVQYGPRGWRLEVGEAMFPELEREFHGILDR